MFTFAMVIIETILFLTEQKIDLFASARVFFSFLFLFRFGLHIKVDKYISELAFILLYVSQGESKLAQIIEREDE